MTPIVRAALGLVLLLSSGCQTAMSLEEVRRVGTSFGGAVFVPPPRTISDITAILDQEMREDPQVVVEARARADEAPPLRCRSPRHLAAESSRSGHFRPPVDRAD